MENPKTSHTEAVHHVGKYLSGTKDQGLILDPQDKSFECYVDADFCGTWDHDRAQDDRSTAVSRTGFLIKYAGCPIMWHSKLQTEIALSTTASEYVALSTALREVIPLMHMLLELFDQGMLEELHTPKIFCKLFEDNAGALEIAKTPKMRPRTKYLNTKYHHFRDYVTKGLIQLEPIGTKDQQADILTKQVTHELFNHFRKLIMGW
jgi:hypothetical protein